MRLMKPTAAVLATAIAALSFSSAAQADYRYRHYRHHHNGGDALAAGIFGFAAGAIVAGALSQPRYYYYDEAPVYYAPPPPPVAYQPVTAYYQPWTPEWYAYCEDRYRSFNDDTGYFYGFDGKYHFCR